MKKLVIRFILIQILFTPMLFTPSFSLFAQNDNRITVVVSDTMNISPEKIYYNISTTINPNINIGGTNEIDDELLKLETVGLLLKQQGYVSNVQLNKSKYAMNTGTTGNPNQRTLIVEVNDELDIEMIIQTLADNPNLKGNIGKMEYRRDEEYDQTILKNILRKAKKKATFLADEMNCSLDRQHSFKEVPIELETVLAGQFNNRNTFGRFPAIDEGLTKVIRMTAEVTYNLKCE